MRLDVLGSLRQLLYPKEFRIAPEPPREQAINLLKTFIALHEKSESKPIRPVDTSPGAGITDGVLSHLGTDLWRMKARMIHKNTGEPSDENRRTFRHLQSAWDLLAESGLRVIDHTNEVVPEGGIYSLKAIAYEPRSELSRETVIETIKPTIYFGDRLIQMGEVIIGTPEPSNR